MNLNPVTAQSAPQVSGRSTTTPTSGAADAESTFLKLLVTQLKTQDPTSPMDPTQMVSQMLSMNQLDQLIQIHQILQDNSTPSQTNTGAH